MSNFFTSTCPPVVFLKIVVCVLCCSRVCVCFRSRPVVRVCCFCSSFRLYTHTRTQPSAILSFLLVVCERAERGIDREGPWRSVECWAEMEVIRKRDHTVGSYHAIRTNHEWLVILATGKQIRGL